MNLGKRKLNGPFRKIIMGLAFAVMILNFTLVFGVSTAMAEDEVYPSSFGLTVNVVYDGDTTNVANYGFDDLTASADTAAFSGIDRMPAPVMSSAYGVTLDSILDDAIGSGNKQYIDTITFKGTDGYPREIDYSDLIETRYYYGNLASEWDYVNNCPGVGTTATCEVEPMLAVDSFVTRWPTCSLLSMQDRFSTVRLLYGQTASDISSCQFTTRNWVHSLNQIDLNMTSDISPSTAAVLAPPTLNGAVADGRYCCPTTYGTAPVLTFTDDASWRSAVTSNGTVYLDGNPTANYTLASGSLTLNTTTLTVGAHGVKISVPGYKDNYAKVYIGLLPPGLDGTDLVTSGIIDPGDDCVISYDDSVTPDWELYTLTVKVNGQSVAFNLDDIENTITIPANQGGWTTSGGYYYITISADNYVDGIPLTVSGNYSTYGQVVSPASI